jgi:signal recognition particle subunit SEC65
VSLVLRSVKIHVKKWESGTTEKKEYRQGELVPCISAPENATAEDFQEAVRDLGLELPPGADIVEWASAHLVAEVVILHTRLRIVLAASAMECYVRIGRRDTPLCAYPELRCGSRFLLYVLLL